MIRTDAFLGYRIEFRNRQMGGDVGLLPFKDFLHKLAYQLIHNNVVRQHCCATSARCRGRSTSACKCKYKQIIAITHVFKFTIFNLSLFIFIQDHRLAPLRTLPAYVGMAPDMRAKRRCIMKDCNKQSSYYCETCSDVNDARRIVPVCNPHNKPHSNCYANHLALNLNA